MGFIVSFGKLTSSVSALTPFFPATYSSFGHWPCFLPMCSAESITVFCSLSINQAVLQKGKILINLQQVPLLLISIRSIFLWF